MILRACTVCGRLSRAHRCQTHVYRDKRPSRQRRGYGAQWQATRRSYLSAYPICQWHEGCLARATDVHHIDDLGPLGPRGYDWDNLQALCHSHHSRITARKPRGWYAGTEPGG